MNKNSIVSIRGVHFSYNGSPVLENVNLEIGSRELICMVGPNGGGKTTLLKLILGLIAPSRGEVRVFGEHPAMARSRIGYMPQHVQVDFQFPVTVTDVVLMGRLGRAKSLGFYSRHDREAVRDALDIVELAAQAKQPFSDLSGGQRQRALMARALASDPELLLFDEPTSNLDLLMEGEFFDLVQRLNQRLTIVLVSHDLGFVSQIVKSVVCVNRRVVVHPTSDLTGEMIKDVYGGDVRMIRHDHRCAEGGHQWGNS